MSLRKKQQVKNVEKTSAHVCMPSGMYAFEHQPQKKNAILCDKIFENKWKFQWKFRHLGVWKFHEGRVEVLVEVSGREEFPISARGYTNPQTSRRKGKLLQLALNPKRLESFEDL